jgi:hypothetical protein
MPRIRLTKPVLVRSTNKDKNSRIVQKSRQLLKRTEKVRVKGVFIMNAFGTKNRVIYNGLP